MLFYKDKSENVHAIESEQFANLLPSDAVKITESDAAKLQTQNTPRSKDVTQIMAQLIDLDVKRVRPLAEGDTAYLAVLNKQAVELRAKLKALQS